MVMYNAAAKMEQNYIGERIAEARQNKKLTLPVLSNKLAEYGVMISANGIHKWERGHSCPNAYQLFALGYALGIEEDMRFFVHGHDEERSELNEIGRQKLADYKADLIASGRYKPVERSGKICYIEMLVSDFPVSAGTGAFLAESSFEKIRFPENTVPAGATFGLRVSGDSMEPVYHDGQIVWVQECNTLRAGEVGIFIYDGNGYMKVYGEQTPDEDCAAEFTDSYNVVHYQPMLISYNEAYDPIVVSPEIPFEIVGRVLS